MTKLQALMLILGVAVSLAMMSQNALAESSSDWINRFKMVQVIKQSKATGKIPVSIQCRNRPGLKVTAKPEFKIRWKPNNSNRPWVMEAEIAHAGLTFGPVQSLGDHRFKLISRDSFTFIYSHRPTKYRCAIWHR